MRINNPQLFNGQYLASREQIFEKLGLDVINNTAQSFAISGLISAKYLDVASIIETKTFTDKFTAIENLIDTVSGAAISVTAGTGITISDGEGTEKTIAIDSSKFKLEKFGVDGEFASQYAFKFNDVQIGETINIPKDQFLTSAAYIPSAEALQLVFQLPQGASNTVMVPVGDLVDEYSAGNGINISDSVSGTNEISVVIDSDSEGFLTVGADGLKLAGVQTAINTASGNVLTSAKAYTDEVSGALTDAFDIKLETLTSGAVAEISGKVDANAAEIAKNAAAIVANTDYIDYVSGQVSGLPAAIDTAKTEAISAASGYTDQVSGILDTTAKGYADAAQAAAEETASKMDFAQIVKVDEVPADAESALPIEKDTLWVTAEGEAKIGFVGEAGLELIDISKEVVAEITDDNKGDAEAVASTKAVVDYVQSSVGTTVSGLYKIAEVSGQTLPATVPGRVIAVYSDAGDKEQCYPTVKPVEGGFEVSADGLADGAETFTISYYAK